jgi:TonB family protein
MNPRPLMIVHAPGMSCDQVRSITDLIQADAKCSPDLCVLSFTTAPPRPALVPAPPAPPLPKPGTRLQPIAPGTWVTNDDYPAEAIRERQQGTSSFRLDVDKNGVVTGCTITGSAGAQILDDAVCTLLKARARFHPALDEQGKPIAASYFNRFRWELPTPDRIVLASWAHDYRYTIGTGGEILSCTEARYGAPPPQKPMGCAPANAPPRELLKGLRGTATGPVTIVERYEHAVIGMPMPTMPPLGAAFKPIEVRRMRMAVEPGGDPAACYVDWGRGEVTVSAAECRYAGAYFPAPDWHSVIRTSTTMTDGDPNVADALDRLMSGQAKP